ncbi:MAG: TetR/AcrR family transcriptional regulator [Coprococcus sp.]
MDRRIQRTRNSLFSAFIELRATKPVEKITVKELTEKANISKQTFYLHFQDIMICRNTSKMMPSVLIGDIPNPEYMLTNPAEASRQLCNAFINQGHLFSILFPDDNRSYGVLTNKLDALIKEKIYDVRPEFRDDLAKNVEVSMFVQGCAYTFLKYKDQDAAMVIDTLAGIIDRATRA